MQILTKSLLPLPDKYYGLADVELRHRQRCDTLRHAAQYITHITLVHTYWQQQLAV